MDPISFPVAVQPTARLGDAFDASTPASTPPVPPPELVGRFEALMARTAEPSAGDPGVTAIPAKTVAAVETHLQHHADAIERVVAMDSSGMSLAELQVAQMQSMVQMGLMSMTQAAYVQILGSSKSAVSALMKNQ